MAVVAVTADNTRIDDAEAATGYSNIGGGASGAAEASFPYQGSNLFNRKVTSSTGAGFYYNPASDGGSAQDMTTNALRTMMVKAIVTDYGGLQATDGFRIRIGSGTTAYYSYIIAGSTAKINSLQAYPARGGLIIVPIDPNISGYRDGTHSTGSPTITAVDYFGCVAAFATASAKSENVGLDAIDLGRGLELVGGDGVDTDGVWLDFVDADEGTSANRWGYASSTFDGIFLFYGTMQVGSPTATEFSDVAANIVWLDGLFQAGWSKAVMDINNSSTTITDGSTHTGLGSTAVEDSRPDYIVLGTEGSFTFSGILNNFREVDLTSKAVVDGATIEAQTVMHGRADIDNTTIVTQEAANAATFKDVGKTEENPYTAGDNSLITRADGTYRRGQAFTANASGILREFTVWLDKSGTPTGNAIARLYASTGTVGTNATPTGSALASSATFDISTLTVQTGSDYDGKTPITFSFTDGYSMTAGTDYVIVIELDGTTTDSTNYVALLADNSTPTHPGNFVTYNGSWASDSTRDCIFTLRQAVDFGNMNNVTFVQGNAGHAIEITEPGTYTLTNINFSGYGGTAGSNLVASSGATDAAVYNNSGGAVTLNITGGDQPSVRNAASSTTTVSVSYNLTVTGVPNGVQMTIVNSSTRAELQNTVSTGADIVYTHSGGETVDILFMANDYDPNAGDIYDLTLPNESSSIPSNIPDDINYENPV